MTRYLLFLARKSLMNRRLTCGLTVLSIALSVMLFVGVERVRQGARLSFAGTISQTDLIVGARGGPIQLLLYSVFRIGSPTGNISYESYDDIRTHPSIAWTIPYSLGDSHRGFRVVGTNDSFYEHYRYRGGQNIRFEHGDRPKEVLQTVVGADVAAALDYKIGDKIILAHGISDTGVSFQNHDDKPFQVSGILAKTNTPIDRSVYVSLQAIEAIHTGWEDGAPPIATLSATDREGITIPEQNLEPKQITTFLVGLHNRIDVLNLQRFISEYEGEPLTAIIPGVALSELWQGLSYAEIGLGIISFFVVLVGLMGMLVSIYISLNERRREMSILRSMGASGKHIFGLLLFESTFLSIAGMMVGIALLYAALLVFRPIIESNFGLTIPIHMLSGREWLYLLIVLSLSVILGLIPARQAYRNTLQDGLMIKL